MRASFNKRYRTMRVFSILFIICLLLSIADFVFIVELAAFRNYPPLPVCAVLLVVLILLMILPHLYIIRHKISEPYALPVQETTDFIKRVTENSGASRIPDSADLYALFQYRGFQMRLLVQRADSLDVKALAQQRKKSNAYINKAHRIKDEGSIFEVKKHARINLLICPQAERDQLLRLNQSTRRMLDRAEVIVNCLYAEEERTVYYPGVFDSMTPLQVKVYGTIFQFISDCCDG